MRYVLIILLLIACTPEPDVSGVAPPEIKAAMLKAGPEYSYRLLEGGMLQINRGDGDGWLRMRYKKEQEK